MVYPIAFQKINTFALKISMLKYSQKPVYSPIEHLWCNFFHKRTPSQMSDWFLSASLAFDRTIISAFRFSPLALQFSKDFSHSHTL